MKISRKKVDRFWKKREKIKDPRISTHFKKDNTHDYDLKLIQKYINKSSEVLDMACGTCYLSNTLVNDVKFIKAVDKFGHFLKYCKNTPKLETKKADILGYRDRRKYDVILLFGIMMYFSDKDTKKIYKNLKVLLKPGGVIIVKHQSGVKKDVVVDKFSEAVGDDYFAYYKSVKKDKSILSSVFKKVKVIDIYPKKLNPWPNTHFYAFVCKK